METLELRPNQRQAVESQARRITVNAGPGSGKTRVLVERISQAVHGGQLRLDRVLAITFTINAAAEMKKRLSATLPRVEVEAARISTIHAFCAGLLREHPVEARVDPAFRVLEEIEATVLKDRVVTALLDQWSARDPREYQEFSLHFNFPLPEVLLTAYREVVSQGGNLSDPQSLLPQDDDTMREHVARAAACLCDFHAAYRLEKDRLSVLDFDDLEARAFELLKDDDLAAAVGARYDEVLVDEYQDTSLLQARIIERIARGRLFVVGDPKQSIYAFRNARPENFDDAIASADEAIALVEDFRSRAEVLDAINDYFETVPGFGGGYTRLVAGKQFAAGGTAVHLLSSGDRPEEASRLARIIRDVVQKQGRDYGDVAMLFRATADIPIYESALAEAGVPYASEKGRGFYDAREVVDVVSFLHVLDNDRDEIALASVLRSPMFGLSDDALFMLANARSQPGSKLCDVLGDRPEVAPFRAIHERLSEVSRARPLDALIHEIVRETGYEDKLMQMPSGDRAVANLRKLEELARTLTASSIGATSPGEFARAVDRFRADDRFREAEAQVPEAGGAVRIMTMHAAKGLEFPVVVVPDLGRKDANESAMLDYDARFGLGSRYFDVEDDDFTHTPTVAAIREEKKKRNKMEEERLLFVAMTRAEEYLLLSGAKVNNDRLKRLANLRLPAPLVPEAVAVSQPVEMAALPAPAIHVIPESDASDFAAAITDVVEFACCPRRYFIGRYLGFSNEGASNLDEDRESRDPDELSATERGTAVHRRLAGDLTDVHPQIEELAHRFEESELGRRVAAAKNVQREQPILARWNGRFLSGILDLRAGNLIVDYKTGKRDDDRYRLQMLLYGLLTGADELYLFYLDAAQEVRVEASPAATKEAREVVERFFEAQRTLDFPGVVADHCQRCPFNGQQCLEPERKRAAAGQSTS